MGNFIPEHLHQALTVDVALTDTSTNLPSIHLILKIERYVFQKACQNIYQILGIFEIL